MPFPVQDLIPKSDTNAATFREKYNGFGCRLGILDTGVDPGAFGVSGPSKLTHVIDCTGSGDVDCSFEASAISKVVEGKESVFCVEGLSGQQLILPPSVVKHAVPFPRVSSDVSKTENKPSDKNLGSNQEENSIENGNPVGIPVRLGLKRAYELYPAKLKKRLQSERSKKLQQALGPHIANARAKLAEVTAQLGRSKSKSKSQLAKEKEDWQERLNFLTSDHEDPGPLYDVVVYWDGNNYRVLLYLEGDVVACRDKPTYSDDPAVGLADYSIGKEYVTLCVDSQMNAAINIHDNGRIVTLVTDASPHGTHVASIASHSEQGVAPGAELVSLKIGDSRLGSMETGTALTRALQEAIRLKCDVVNLSYGEGCQVPNSGRFVKLLEEAVYKHNIIFVSSAGNNGPALSTVGAPGGTSSATIGVAAHVSEASMKANYSMMSDGNKQNEESNTETPSGTTYTWSSVGPTVDGDVGVDITAPGGAITSVSNWTLQSAMLMNGTSMSSPHAAGCVALLVSACKKKKIPVSPVRIKRALQNTSLHLPGLLAAQQGRGMIQVDKAMEYLEEFQSEKAEDVWFSVRVQNKEDSRGIYLRDQHEVSMKHTFVVQVTPCFRRQDLSTEESQRGKIDFSMGFSLSIAETTREWIQGPAHFMLMNQERSFKITVDPTSLKPGVHEGVVYGLDSERPERGPLFSLPITIVKPLPVQRVVRCGELALRPTEVRRFFVTPPPGSTWMDVTVVDRRDVAAECDASTKLCVLHTIQLLPHGAYRDFEKQKYLSLCPGQSTVTSIPVEDGVTCEVAVARYWSTVGTTKLEISVEFRGVTPVPNKVHMVCGERSSLVRVFSNLSDEFISPKAVLNKWLAPLRPKADAVLSPLGDRDKLPSLCGDIYQLILEYEFDQDEKGSFVPRIFGVQGVLYESAFESQLILVFDGERKYLGCADAWPGEITAPKGKVLLRVQIRHDDATKLEKLKDIPLWIERKIEKEIVLNISSTREDTMNGDGAVKRRLLQRGSAASLFFAEPQQTKLPANCKHGDILSGYFSLGSGDATLPGEGKRPGGFPLSFAVGPKIKKSSSETENAETEDERTVDVLIEEAVRDAKLKQLGRLKDKEEQQFNELYEKLKSEYADHLPLRMLKIQHLDALKDRASVLEHIVSEASEALKLIPEDELALHFGRKIDTDNPEAVKEREKMKEKKACLVEVYVRMTLAYSEMSSDEGEQKFCETLQKAKAWVDVDSSDKYATLTINREIREERYGNALKTINKLLEKDSLKEDAIRPMSRSELYQKRLQVLEKLNWNLIVDYEKKNRVISCPKAFMLF